MRTQGEDRHPQPRGRPPERAALTDLGAQLPACRAVRHPFLSLKPPSGASEQTNAMQVWIVCE